MSYICSYTRKIQELLIYWLINYLRICDFLWKTIYFDSYIEWSSHEPEKGTYDFSGDKDLIGFLKTAQEVGLVVILRAGPFIAAERDMVFKFI